MPQLWFGRALSERLSNYEWPKSKRVGLSSLGATRTNETELFDIHQTDSINNDHVFGAVDTTAKDKILPENVDEIITVIKPEPEVKTAGQNFEYGTIITEPFEIGKQLFNSVDVKNSLEPSIKPFLPVSGEANKIKNVREVHTNSKTMPKYKIAYVEIKTAKSESVPWDPGIKKKYLVRFHEGSVTLQRETING